MDESTLARRRRLNLLQSGLLLLAILAATWWITALLFGAALVPWVIAGMAIGLLTAPRVPHAMIMRMHGAVALQPWQAPVLFEALDELSRRAGLPQRPQLFYVPHPGPNAFAVGTREDAAIGLSRGLLGCMEQREVVGILAHEIAHIRHNDMRFMLLATSATHFVAALAMLAWVLLLANLPLALLGLNLLPLGPLFLLILMPTVVVLLQMALSRTREYDADLESARLTGRPEWLISALRKLERTHNGMLENMRVGRQRMALFSTHPPTERRVQRLCELLPSGRAMRFDPWETTESLLHAFPFPERLPQLRRGPWWW